MSARRSFSRRSNQRSLRKACSGKRKSKKDLIRGLNRKEGVIGGEGTPPTFLLTPLKGKKGGFERGEKGQLQSLHVKGVTKEMTTL